jgi:hypothetical protein
VFWKGGAVFLPGDITRKISERAAEIVRHTAPVGSENNRRRIRATSIPGQIGVYFPPQAMHLFYLDRGIKPFLMKSLEGKTIPIRGPGGQISFRVAKNVGRRNIVTRDEKGRIVKTTLSWRHPGVPAMNFVQPAIDRAIAEWVDSLTPKELVEMFGNMRGPIADFFNRLEVTQRRFG